MMKETVSGGGRTKLLSPVLFAGMALRPLPPVLMQPALDIAMTTIRRRHPELFDRLSCLENPVFLIDPVDLPLVFILRPGDAAPSLRAARNADSIGATATLRGPLMDMLGLLEGTSDGDALFFSRSLSFEGNTEAVVALRNAVDDAEIDLLDDLCSVFGPLARPARRVAGIVAGVASRATRDMEMLRSVFAAPAIRRNNGPETKLKKLDGSKRTGRKMDPPVHGGPHPQAGIAGIVGTAGTHD